MWRQLRPSSIARGSRLAARHASSKAKPGPSKPIVLEKPAKFNPPSHGSRLPKKPRQQQHYGGDLSAAEAAAQKVKDYPGTMAPKGTLSHWFLHSRAFHLTITMVR